jgi:hypothetical protein
MVRLPKSDHTENQAHEDCHNGNGDFGLHLKAGSLKVVRDLVSSDAGYDFIDNSINVPLTERNLS